MFGPMPGVMVLMSWATISQIETSPVHSGFIWEMYKGPDFSNCALVFDELSTHSQKYFLRILCQCPKGWGRIKRGVKLQVNFLK
jgi:hypothetical protein